MGFLALRARSSKTLVFSSVSSPHGHEAQRKALDVNAPVFIKKQAGHAAVDAAAVLAVAAAPDVTALMATAAVPGELAY